MYQQPYQVDSTLSSAFDESAPVPASSTVGFPALAGTPPARGQAGVFDSDFGHILGTTTILLNPPNEVAENIEFRRLERWALQSEARKLLKVPGKVEKQERICHCLRRISPYNKRGVLDAVEVVQAQESKTFHYGNLMTCKSVWVCSICGCKISEGRKEELVQVHEQWKKRSGQILLLTLTVPHTINDSCQKVQDGLSRALYLMANRKPFKRLAAAVGLVGRIRSLETTIGPNGWHIHFHILLFLQKSLQEDSLPALEESLFSMWHSAALDAGLTAPSRSHGLQLQNGDEAASYICKWGIENEMTKGHLKSSSSGYGVFDLLRVSLGTFDQVRDFQLTQERARDLFREFARTFKGKKQLHWSKGLRDLFDLEEEKTDDELAEEVDEKAVRFALIPREVWRVVLAGNKRGELLAVCRQGPDVLFDWLTDLCDKAGTLNEGEIL